MPNDDAKLHAGDLLPDIRKLEARITALQESVECLKEANLRKPVMETLVEEGQVVCIMQVDGITYGLGFRIEDANGDIVQFRKLFDHLGAVAAGTLAEKGYFDSPQECGL